MATNSKASAFILDAEKFNNGLKPRWVQSHLRGFEEESSSVSLQRLEVSVRLLRDEASMQEWQRTLYETTSTF